MATLDQLDRKLIKVVGFDLDGTLYPTTPEIQERIRGKIAEKIAAACGIDVKKARIVFDEKYERFLSGSKTLDEIGREYGADFSNREVVQEAVEEANILDLIDENPRLVGMLQRLSGHRELDLLTSSEENLALQKLGRIGLSRYFFRFFLTKKQGSKTTGEKYKLWLSKRVFVPFAPEEHLYVGDNERQDVDIPGALGIRTCVIGNYEGADFRISDILELEALLS